MISVNMQVLKRAREIISDKENWCQGASARDENGEGCAALYRRATNWCAWGALVKAASEVAPNADPIATADVAAASIARAAGYGWFELHIFNDSQGHAAVLSLFDKALAEEPAP